MDNLKTPSRKKHLSSELIIPPSPLMSKLGYGTGVTVYKLNRSLTNSARSPWAIKKLSKLNRNKELVTQRLCDEASILRNLQHPNIIGFRAFTRDSQGKICLAMEIATTCLGDLIETQLENDNSPFKPKPIIKVASDMAKALSYLHEEALILHCDIKSYNILVKGDFDVCKLCDFGVAVRLNPNGTVNEDDVDRDLQPGTQAWMAPEVVVGYVLSTKSDVYSYGVTIWEMLALIPPPLPFDDESFVEDSEILVESSFDSVGSKVEESFRSELKRVNGRPELPHYELSEDYNHVLEIFCCCTEENAELRPKAKDLVLITDEIIKEINKN